MKIWKKPRSSSSSHFTLINVDLLIEILKRLDHRSLAIAACVCRLWCSLSRNDSLWEHLCFRSLSPPPDGVRTVVAALGGYRRLYMLCVKPVVVGKRRTVRSGGGGGGRDRDRDVVWMRHQVELALSLFCVDYYERVMLLGSGGGGRIAGDTTPPSSLMLLCKAVNV